MEIPLCDIRASDAHYRDEIDEAVKRIIDDSSFILGKPVEEFEKNFAKYIGTKHAIGVSSCTMALYLSLKALGIKEGDEVIVPNFTIAADIEPVLMCGATPVLCGVKEDGCIDEYEMRNRITKRTGAIIVVHLYGNACPVPDMEKMTEIPIIEDCAQSTGTTFEGQMTGSFTDLGCFSFFPSKNLGAYGDGGMVTTDDDELAGTIRMLRNHGRAPGERYHHSMIGVNSRLNAMQAAILNVKLKHLNNAIKKKRKIAKLYNKYLNDIPQVITPTEIPVVNHSYYMYSVRATERRDELLKFLVDNGIKASVHYPLRLSDHPIYAKYYSPLEDEPTIGYILSKTVLSLPMFPALEEEAVKYICQKVREFYEKN